MNVLLVTNMYPSEARPTYGIFVKEQVEALSEGFGDLHIDVKYIDPQSERHAYLKSITALPKIIRNGQYDLVHIHYGLSGLYMLNPLRPKIPTIVTLHGGDIQPEQGKNVQVALTHRILRRADAAIALNDRMTELALRYCRRVEQIPCAVDTDIFTGQRRSKPYDGKRAARIVFSNDPSRTVKNYPLFLKTVELLRKNHGIDSEILIMKDMNRSQVADLLRSADLLLLTSISEGSPQAVKEAMACNLPVVSTPVGDVKELLKGVSGSACAETHTPEELADLAAKSLRGEIKGLEPSERLFRLGLDKACVAQKIHNLYINLLKK